MTLATSEFPVTILPGASLLISFLCQFLFGETVFIRTSFLPMLSRYGFTTRFYKFKTKCNIMLIPSLRFSSRQIMFHTDFTMFTDFKKLVARLRRDNMTRRTLERPALSSDRASRYFSLYRGMSGNHAIFPDRASRQTRFPFLKRLS